MKSNKQRRAEIKQLRLQRAARADAQLRQAGYAGHRPLRVAGAEAADREVLALHNNTYGLLPAFYVDRPFRCRDCGAEAVWTAMQQKWWYEAVGANLNSGATRCLACRRVRRAALAKARSAPGANLVGDEVAWLRSVSASRPDAQTERRVEAALTSKWDGVRKVAIDVLGRWRRMRHACARGRGTTANPGTAARDGRQSRRLLQCCPVRSRTAADSEGGASTRPDRPAPAQPTLQN